MMNFETLKQDILREMAKATELRNPQHGPGSMQISNASYIKDRIEAAANAAYWLISNINDRYHSGVDALREGAERDLEALRK